MRFLGNSISSLNLNVFITLSKSLAHRFFSESRYEIVILCMQSLFCTVYMLTIAGGPSFTLLVYDILSASTPSTLTILAGVHESNSIFIPLAVAHCLNPCFICCFNMESTSRSSSTETTRGSSRDSYSLLLPRSVSTMMRQYRLRACGSNEFMPLGWATTPVRLGFYFKQQASKLIVVLLVGSLLYFDRRRNLVRTNSRNCHCLPRLVLCSRRLGKQAREKTAMIDMKNLIVHLFLVRVSW